MRVLQLLDALQDRVDLSVWCVDSDEADATGLMHALSRSTVEVFPRKQNSNTTSISNAGRYVRALSSGVPSWVLKRESPRLTRRLGNIGREFDAIIALGEASAMYMHIEDRWHWDKFNVLTASSRADAAAAQGPKAKLKAAIDGVIARRFERGMAHRPVSVSVTNGIEAERFQQLFGTPATILHSYVETPDTIVRSPIPRRLLWLGNMSYRSNTDGLRRFLDEAWPKLDSRFTLRVVGSGMNDEQKGWLSEFNCVEAVGFIPDLSDELASAEIGVVPLWSGGGTKIKTLTMMAHGLPVVGTGPAFEGISLGSPERYVSAETPSDIAAALERMTGESWLAPMAESARNYVASSFSTTGSGAQEQLGELTRLLSLQATAPRTSIPFA